MYYFTHAIPSKIIHHNEWIEYASSTIKEWIEGKTEIRDDYDLLCKCYDLFRGEGRKFPTYDVDRKVISSRKQLQKLFLRLHMQPSLSNYLDIGCHMGYHPRAAFEIGCLSSYGIDLHSNPAWSHYLQGTEEKLHFIAEDIHTIEFPCSFNLITSFNAFEHFSDPEAMLSRVSRLLAHGGIFYTSFGPLYNHADGPHMYRSVPIPWYTLLFSPEVCTRFYDEHNITPHSYDYVNGWSALDYTLMAANITKSTPDMEILSVIPHWDFRYSWFADLFHRFLPFSQEELFLQTFELIFQRNKMKCSPQEFIDAKNYTLLWLQHQYWRVMTTITLGNTKEICIAHRRNYAKRRKEVNKFLNI